MKIEIYGLPGTGKSTYIKNNQGLQINGKMEKLFFFILFSLHHPLKSIKFIINIFLYTNSCDLRSYFRLILKKLLVLYPASVAIEEKAFFFNHWLDSVMFEDGIITLALSTFDAEISEKNIVDYDMGNSIFLFEIDSETRIERMKTRGREPRKNILSPDLYKQYLEIIDINHKVITKTLRARIIGRVCQK